MHASTTTHLSVGFHHPLHELRRRLAPLLVLPSLQLVVDVCDVVLALELLLLLNHALQHLEWELRLQHADDKVYAQALQYNKPTEPP